MPSSGFAGDFKEPSSAEITTAIKTFQLHGEWIHPKIIKEFLPLQADHQVSLVQAIDVGAATGTNRYFGETKFQDEAKRIPSFSTEEGESISYEWKGRLQNGMHVLLTRESGAGTLVSTNLLVFRLKKGTGTKADGKKYRQLNLKIERAVNLGDRAIPIVAIKGNAIEVNSEFNGARKSESKTITFPKATL
mgnify:FL=1